MRTGPILQFVVTFEHPGDPAKVLTKWLQDLLLPSRFGAYFGDACVNYGYTLINTAYIPVTCTVSYFPKSKKSQDVVDRLTFLLSVLPAKLDDNTELFSFTVTR